MFVGLTNGERCRCLGASLISISVHIWYIPCRPNLPHTHSEDFFSHTPLHHNNCGQQRVSRTKHLRFPYQSNWPTFGWRSPPSRKAVLFQNLGGPKKLLGNKNDGNLDDMDRSHWDLFPHFLVPVSIFVYVALIFFDLFGHLGSQIKGCSTKPWTLVSPLSIESSRDCGQPKKDPYPQEHPRNSKKKCQGTVQGISSTFCLWISPNKSPCGNIHQQQAAQNIPKVQTSRKKAGLIKAWERYGVITCYVSQLMDLKLCKTKPQFSNKNGSCLYFGSW